MQKRVLHERCMVFIVKWGELERWGDSCVRSSAVCCKVEGISGRCVFVILCSECKEAQEGWVRLGKVQVSMCRIPCCMLGLSFMGCGLWCYATLCCGYVGRTC